MGQFSFHPCCIQRGTLFWAIFWKKCYLLLNYLGKLEHFIKKISILPPIFVFRSYNKTKLVDALALNVKSDQYQVLLDHFIQQIWQKHEKTKKYYQFAKKVKSWIEFKKVVKKQINYNFSKPVARNEIQFGHSLRGSPTSMPIRESSESNYLLFFWLRLIEKTYTNDR